MGDHHFLGLLRLKVERGVDLAIRDKTCKSSDPYVIFHLGNHRVRTHVKKKTTNPEWNDTLTLSVEDPNVPLHLNVFDKDLIKDDLMGHAEIDLSLLIESGNQDLSNGPDGTVIKTVAPSDENHLAEESKIYWSEGKIIQDMVIDLQDVESGKIELKLIWTAIH